MGRPSATRERAVGHASGFRPGGGQGQEVFGERAGQPERNPARRRRSRASAVFLSGAETALPVIGSNRMTVPSWVWMQERA